MFKTKYRIKKTINAYGDLYYDAQYKKWYWPFWTDIMPCIYRESEQCAIADIEKHKKGTAITYTNYI